MLTSFQFVFFLFSFSSRDPTREWDYEMPFDVNVKDGTGQSALYLACVLGNLKMVEYLLKFRVKVTNFKVG